MADTTLFAGRKEPKCDIEEGEKLRELLNRCFTTACLGHEPLRRSPPAHGVRTIMAFLGKPCRWHDEQCTLAEFSAYTARDVLAHIDLAAEARVKAPVTSQNDEEAELESHEDNNPRRARAVAELVDIGGGNDGNVDAEMEDVPVGELSRRPLRDVMTTIELCFQQRDLASLDTKSVRVKPTWT